MSKYRNLLSPTGVISGKPLEEMEMKRFTITAKNEEGSVYTTLTITVNKAPFNWLLLVIIVVVVVVVVVVIVVVVVNASKKDKKVSKTMPKGSKAPKGKPATKPAPQTKAAIKV